MGQWTPISHNWVPPGQSNKDNTYFSSVGSPCVYLLVIVISCNMYGGITDNMWDMLKITFIIGAKQHEGANIVDKKNLAYLDI